MWQYFYSINNAYDILFNKLQKHYKLLNNNNCTWWLVIIKSAVSYKIISTYGLWVTNHSLKLETSFVDSTKPRLTVISFFFFSFCFSFPWNLNLKYEKWIFPQPIQNRSIFFTQNKNFWQIRFTISRICKFTWNVCFGLSRRITTLRSIHMYKHKSQ